MMMHTISIWTPNKLRLDCRFWLLPAICGNAESATSWFMMNSLEYHDIDLGIISHTWHMRLITRMIIKILSDLKHLKILCYKSCGSFNRLEICAVTRYDVIIPLFTSLFWLDWICLLLGEKSRDSFFKWMSFCN